MKTGIQERALAKAQDIYDDAAMDAIGTKNFWLLESYSRMLYKAEGIKPITLPLQIWEFISKF